MSVPDRIGRSLFVALAVGLAWGIRGDFGHLVGAMYPGAVLALALAYVSGQRSLFGWMPVLAGVSALAIGSGGMYSNPDGLARTILWMVDGACVLGFIGAAIWMVIHFQRRQRWAFLPVLWLSGTMLLFQNLTAHYFFYSARPKYINMHHVFWVMFGLMLLYAFFSRPLPVEMALGSSDVPEPRLAVLGWLAATVAAVGIVIFLAGFVNNEKTMATANTRWPVWAWPDGPFPGRGNKL